MVFNYIKQTKCVDSGRSVEIVETGNKIMLSAKTNVE